MSWFMTRVLLLLLTCAVQVIIFVSHSIFMEQDTVAGVQLLKWMRSYLEMDMYASLRSHSEVTIAMGRAELRVFEKEMKVSLSLHSVLSNLLANEACKGIRAIKPEYEGLELSQDSHSLAYVQRHREQGRHGQLQYQIQ